MPVSLRIGFPLLLLALGCSRSRQPAAFGAACTGTICEGGLACVVNPRFPGGYCSADCTSRPCGEGATCARAFAPNLCLAQCTAATDCRSDYQCWLGACWPLCDGDADCGGAGATCVGRRCSGPECTTAMDCGPGMLCLGARCIMGAGDGGSGLAVGSPCVAGNQCATGICLAPELDGVCARACGRRASCGAAEVCSPALVDFDGDGVPDTATGACVRSNPMGRFLAGRCTDGAQCESRACVRGQQCTEACIDDSDCLAGQACLDLAYPGAMGITYRGCWYRGRGGGGIRVSDVDLGTIPVRVGAASRRFNFGVPNDAVSVTLLAQQTGGPSRVVSFLDVWDSADTTLFNYARLLTWEDPVVRWLPAGTEEHASMLIPNSTRDRVAYRRGRYGFDVALISQAPGDTATGTLALTARIKRAAAGDVTSGTLDLNIFLVGVGLTAAQARTNTRLQGALSQLGRILNVANISTGTISYTQITGAAASRYAIIDSTTGPTSEMSELLRLSSSQTNQAINVFLVQEIASGGEGGIALGIAGGIPGPPSVHGTMHSGVLVAFSASVVGGGVTGQRIVAQIMAHEIGHYLGLYHVREGLAPCPTGTGPTMARPCAPFGGGDVLSDTTRTSGSNLMWYALGGSSGRTYNTQLSAGQGFVLLRGAVVR